MLKQFARVILCCMAWAAAVAPQVLHAQAFPSKPIRMIVPWPPGGGTDIVARTVAQKMSENMGQPVIIENKPGAAAIIGTDLAAKAEPDGYTVLMGNLGPNAANAALYKQLPYDVVKDFAPVSLVATAPYIMVVHPSVPVSSVREFIDLAKKSPGKLNFGTGGIGSPPHLATELFALFARATRFYSGVKDGFRRGQSEGDIRKSLDLSMWEKLERSYVIGRNINRAYLEIETDSFDELPSGRAGEFEPR
jgi:tripartite-type tricarboxylate transporter receptor subunit TctC